MPVESLLDLPGNFHEYYMSPLGRVDGSGPGRSQSASVLN